MMAQEGVASLVVYRREEMYTMCAGHAVGGCRAGSAVDPQLPLVTTVRVARRHPE